MKIYIAYFKFDLGNKISVIKVLRQITQMDLKECKDFVEEKIWPSLPGNFVLRLTEQQLGRYFIAQSAARGQGLLTEEKCWLDHFDAEPEPNYLDITQK